MKMKAIGLLAVALAIFPMAFGTAADLPSPKTIVDNYVKAIGGKDALAGIKNSVQKGNMMIAAMGMSAKMTNYVALPNAKVIVEIEGFGEFVSGIKDGTPWSSDMMNGDQVLDGAEAKSALQQADPQMWLHWQDYYPSAETVAEETVGDAAAYKVVFTPEEGEARTYWFDTKSGLNIQSTGAGPAGPATIAIDDYRDVGGVLVAHRNTIEGDQGAIEIAFESIEHNTEIDPAIFDVPEAIAALMASSSGEGSDEK